MIFKLVLLYEIVIDRAQALSSFALEGEGSEVWITLYRHLSLNSFDNWSIILATLEFITKSKRYAKYSSLFIPPSFTVCQIGESLVFLSLFKFVAKKKILRE